MNYRGIKGSTQHVNYFGIWLLLLRLYKIVIHILFIALLSKACFSRYKLIACKILGDMVIAVPRTSLAQFIIIIIVRYDHVMYDDELNHRYSHLGDITALNHS